MKFLRLVRAIGQFDDSSHSPMIQSIEVSPRMLERLRSAGIPSAEVPADYLGFRVGQNAVLEDHMAILKFAGGSIGYWDMRGEEVRVIPQSVGGAAGRLSEPYDPSLR